MTMTCVEADRAEEQSPNLEGIYLADLPSPLVIRGSTWRQKLNPFWSSFIIPDRRPPARFEYELQAAPEELTLSEQGTLEWIPNGETAKGPHTVNVDITANWPELEPVCQSFSFSVQVADRFPILATPEQYTVIHEGSRVGASGILLEELNDLREEANWSLINPPLGLLISDGGSLSWDTSIGSRSADPIEVIVRAEYNSGTEVFRDEETYTFYLLGTSPEDDWSSFRADSFSQKEDEFHGWELEYDNGWLAAGAPGFDNPQTMGQVRIWQRDLQERWSTYPQITLQSHLTEPEQAYGASIALDSRDADTLLAIGAPGLSSGSSNSAGAVYLYRETPTTVWDLKWELMSLLTNTTDHHDYRLGEAVDLNQGWLAASASGYREHNTAVGAVSLFKPNTEGSWEEIKKIINPVTENPPLGFGYPLALESSWMAVSSVNENDKEGRVYLYQLGEAGWTLQQKLVSPEAAPDARFGSRIHLTTEWLFVSSPAALGNRGTVDIFHLRNGQWNWHQTLHNFARHENSYAKFFGAAVDTQGDTLIVTAAGGFSFTYDSPRIGEFRSSASVFRLIDGHWQLERMNEEYLSHIEQPLLGHSLALISEDQMVLGNPTYNTNNDGDPLTRAGRIFHYQWSNHRNSYQSYQIGLPADQQESAGPDGDLDRNGLSNLFEWVWGLDPTSDHDSFGNFDPRFYQPFLDQDQSGTLRFMLPEIKNTAGIRYRILTSIDLEHWTEAPEVSWGSEDSYFFLTAENTRNSGSFQPAILGKPKNGKNRFYKLEITAE